MGLALAAVHSRATTREALLAELDKAAHALRSTRPTAWNLFYGIGRVLERTRSTSGGVGEIARSAREEALRMASEDVEANRKIGEYGAVLLNEGDGVLTHCNAGTLATVSYGTALAPIRTAVQNGKRIQVYATETRPRMQGAKLTTYELLRDKIPVTLIVDGAVGLVMSKGMISKVITGADRITKDAVFNKIGTYQIAVLSKRHGIPFYVAAPRSTFDLTRRADEVRIEERDPAEMTHVGPKRIVPKGVPVYNPAFDMTPTELVDGFITEYGVISPQNIAMERFVASP
jgi:methylthioribose-1-phosphate isomerase